MAALYWVGRRTPPYSSILVYKFVTAKHKRCCAACVSVCLLVIKNKIKWFVCLYVVLEFSISVLVVCYNPNTFGLIYAKILMADQWTLPETSILKPGSLSHERINVYCLDKCRSNFNGFHNRLLVLQLVFICSNKEICSWNVKNSKSWKVD